MLKDSLNLNYEVGTSVKEWEAVLVYVVEEWEVVIKYMFVWGICRFKKCVQVGLFYKEIHGCKIVGNILITVKEWGNVMLGCVCKGL